MEENNLDKYFQEQLAGHTEEPPPAIWDGIASQLPKGRFVWNKRYLLLLLLFISIGGAAFLGVRLYQMDSRVAELEEKIKTEEHESVVESEENPVAKEKENSSEISSDDQKSSSPVVGENDSETIAAAEKSNQENNPIGSENPTESEQLASKPNTLGKTNPADSKAEKLANMGLALNPSANVDSSDDTRDSNQGKTTATTKEESQNKPQSNSGFLAESEVELNNSSMPFNPIRISSIIPSALVSPEFIDTTREVDYYKQPGKSWYLFVYGMANYTHRRIIVEAEGSEGLPNQLDKAENGLITPGGGLQLSRELSPSLRLNIGAEYNQWIQEGSYGIEVQFEDVSVETNTLTELAEFNFDGNIESSFGSNFYNSSTAENPLGEDFATASPNLEPLAIQLETRRRISYLAIPITLEYVLNAYPFRFTAGGGISVNHIIGSDFSFEVEPDAPGFEVGEVEAVEGTYLAFQAGFGVEYGISERMSLRLRFLKTRKSERCHLE
jgi:hypothetical protein